MKSYNGHELYKVIEQAEKENIGYKIEVKSVQGLKGVYLTLDDLMKVDGEYCNAILIEDI